MKLITRKELRDFVLKSLETSDLKFKVSLISSVTSNLDRYFSENDPNCDSMESRSSLGLCRITCDKYILIESDECADVTLCDNFINRLNDCDDVSIGIWNSCELKQEGLDSTFILDRIFACFNLLSNPLNLIRRGYLSLDLMGYKIDVEHIKKYKYMAAEAWRIRDYERSGFYIFESFNSVESRALWTRNILEALIKLGDGVDADILEFLNLARDLDDWRISKEVFRSIRNSLLSENYDDISRYLLEAAEVILKIVYNDSFSPMIFDRDSGWTLASSISKCVGCFDDCCCKSPLERIFLRDNS